MNIPSPPDFWGWLPRLKDVAWAGGIVVGIGYLGLQTDPVKNALAQSSGAAGAQKTAEQALLLAQSTQTTINALNDQIVEFTGAMTTAQQQIASTSGSLAGIATRLDSMTQKLLDMDARNTQATVAPMSIVEPGRIEDMAIGSRGRVTIRFSQDRDCGRADHWAVRFRDSAGLSGAFEDLSVNDEAGFGPRFDVAPNSLRDYTFTAVLPGDDLFSPGVAQGRVIVSGWQLCPDADEARSPPIAFTILPATTGAKPTRR